MSQQQLQGLGTLFCFFLISVQATILSPFAATIEVNVILFRVAQFSSTAEIVSTGIDRVINHWIKPVKFPAWRTHVPPPLAEKRLTVDVF